MSADRLALSSGARAAGAVISLGYLVGVIPGAVPAVAAGLALVAFGRGLVVDRARSVQVAFSWAALALALLVAALRWGTVSLDELRGAQAVLGPTVLVQPDEAAVGAWLAVAGGVLAAGVLLAAAPPTGWRSWLIVAGEASVPALALVTAFWGPALVVSSDRFLVDLSVWVAGVGTVVIVGMGLLWGLRRLSHAWTWVATSLAVTCSLAGVVLVPSLVGP